uniref:Annexin A2 n=1 Tax=Molossus molossus TaxID=27622 RepID=A0A7J8JRN0_MOLMO|nr:hypothetical protein HJG59_000776 [Molossus molossus]
MIILFRLIKAYTNFDADWDALNIETTIKTKGVDEVTTINILTNRSNDQRSDIAFMYQRTKKELASALKLEEQRWLCHYELTDQDSRDPSGVKREGTDVPKWISIMTKQSMCYLQKVCERYKSYSHYDVLESIKKEVKGDLENAFLNLVQCIQTKSLYFADQLYDSMKGNGMCNKVLIRIMDSAMKWTC